LLSTVPVDSAITPKSVDVRDRRWHRASSTPLTLTSTGKGKERSAGRAGFLPAIRPRTLALGSMPRAPAHRVRVPAHSPARRDRLRNRPAGGIAACFCGLLPRSTGAPVVRSGGCSHGGQADGGPLDEVERNDSAAVIDGRSGDREHHWSRW